MFFVFLLHFNGAYSGWHDVRQDFFHEISFLGALNFYSFCPCYCIEGPLISLCRCFYVTCKLVVPCLSDSGRLKSAFRELSHSYYDNDGGMWWCISGNQVTLVRFIIFFSILLYFWINTSIFSRYSFKEIDDRQNIHSLSTLISLQ